MKSVITKSSGIVMCDLYLSTAMTWDLYSTVVFHELGGNVLFFLLTCMLYQHIYKN